jgi:ferritin-like metal-binding protein YciE
MNEQQKKTYIAWLNDAHAMELGLVKVLEKQVADTEGQPTMQKQLQQHLEETKRHAEMMKECVERNDSSTSTTKDVMSQVSATINGLGLSMMSDLMVKNVHSSYAAEHFEIASYLTLKAAADALGDTETVAVCEEILKDEEKMADWLSEQLPKVVRKHINSL